MYLYPVPSKCDPHGDKFCTKAIPFRLTEQDPLVEFFLAEETRMHEASYTEEQRAKEPLFSSSPGIPFLRGQIDHALADALRLFVPEQIASHISWHSYRVRLACKLKACQCDNPTIQAMVRWNTDRAVSIYGRFERDEYWRLLEKARQVDATSVQFTALPEIDEAQRLLEHLGLTNNTWTEVATHLQKLLPSQFTSAEKRAPPALVQPVETRPEASDKRPVVPTPPRVETKPGNARGNMDLPPGFTRQVVEARARSYQVFIGPKGAKAYSKPEAWRLHHGQSRCLHALGLGYALHSPVTMHPHR